MAFDPDAWLKDNGDTLPAVAVEDPPAFDPDAWLKDNAPAPEPAASQTQFDPDAWLAAQEPMPTSPPVPPVAAHPALQPPVTAKPFNKPGTAPVNQPMSAPTPMAANPATGQPEAKTMGSEASLWQQGNVNQQDVGPTLANAARLSGRTGNLESEYLNRMRSRAQAGNQKDVLAYHNALRQRDAEMDRAESIDINQGAVDAGITSYQAVKGASGAVTFGLAPALLTLAEKATGAQVDPETGYQQGIATAANMIGLIGGGTQMAPLVGKVLPVLANPMATRAVIRAAVSGIQSGVNNIADFIAGRETGKGAIANVVQDVVTSAISVVPEMKIPPGVRNAVGQVATQLVTDIITDTVRGRMKGTGDAQWWATRELPSLAMATVFAVLDLTPEGRRTLMRDQAEYRKFKEKVTSALPPPLPAQPPPLPLQTTTAESVARVESAPMEPALAGMTPEQQSAIARPQTQAEYDALPGGTSFLNPGDGQVKIKPQEAANAPQERPVAKDIRVEPPRVAPGAAVPASQAEAGGEGGQRPGPGDRVQAAQTGGAVEVQPPSKLPDLSPAAKAVVKPTTLPDPTLADVASREKQPGIEYKAPANSVVIQLRGMDTFPLSNGMYAFPYDGSPESIADVVSRNLRAIGDGRDWSQRESPIIATDGNGVAKWWVKTDMIGGRVHVEPIETKPWAQIAWKPTAPSAKPPELMTPDVPVMYHGSTKDVKGALRPAKGSGTIKSRFGPLEVVGTVFDGVFLSKNRSYAKMYSAGKETGITEHHIDPAAKVLRLPDIISEEVLSSRGWGRAKGLTSLRQPTQPFPFQAEFEAYAFDRLNKERIGNNRAPFTREEFNRRLGGQFDPSNADYDLEGLAAKYLPDFIKSQGYDAVEMGRETVVLNPEVIKTGTPPGYVRSGDRYVFKPSPAAAVQLPRPEDLPGLQPRQQNAPVGEGTIAPVAEPTYGPYRKVNGKWQTKAGKPLTDAAAKGVEKRWAKKEGIPTLVEAPVKSNRGRSGISDAAAERNPIAIIVNENGGIRPYKRNAKGVPAGPQEHYSATPLRYRARAGRNGLPPDLMLEAVQKQVPTITSVEEMNAALAGQKKGITENDYYEAMQSREAAASSKGQITAVKTGEPSTVPRDVLEQGSLTWHPDEGKWRMADVKKTQTNLIDDTTIKMKGDQTTTIGGAIHPDDPGYAAAFAEYQAQERAIQKAKGGKNEPPPLEVKPYTMDELAVEKAKQAQREKLRDLASKPLVGGAIDTTGDLFDQNAAENPLFAARTPKPKEKSIPSPAEDETSIPYSRDMDIRNLDALARGTGARYLEVVNGEGNALIAKRWRRSPVVREGVILIDMEAPKPAAREPWQMTRAEWESYSGGARDHSHKMAILDAIDSGKPVPPEVLAEYPDLAPKPAPPPSEGAPAKSATVEDALSRGEPVKLPEGTLRVKATYASGRTATVDKGDVSSLALAGEPIVKVEALQGKDKPVPGAITIPDALDGMTRDQLNARAKELNVSAKGRNDAVREAIRAAEATADQPTTPEQSEIKRARGLMGMGQDLGIMPGGRRTTLPASTMYADPLARSFADKFEQNQKAVAERFRFNATRFRDFMAAALRNISRPIERRVQDYGPEGKAIIDGLDKLRGATPKASLEITDAIRDIESTIPHNYDERLDRLIMANRVLEATDIQAARGVQRENPFGMTRDEAQAFITAEQQALGPQRFTALQTAAQKYWRTMETQIGKLHAAGLLSDAGRDAILRDHKHYSPMRFIHHIDPDIASFSSTGRKVSSPDSGLKKLQEGSDNAMIGNWRYLLGQVVARTENRIAKNNANVALHTLAQMPDNPLGARVGNQNIETPRGFDNVDLMIGGKPERVWMPEEVAKYWSISDPDISERVAKLTNWMSGATPVRALATGYNPEFSFRNLFIDAAYTWFRTPEYSTFMPTAIGQRVTDFYKTAHDAWTFGPRTRAYINEGGSMDFLTQQGSLIRKEWEHPGPHHELLNTVQKILSKLNNFSEIWGRLAIRERAIANGKSPQDASLIARNTLDFRKGGFATKAIDRIGIPYLNAGVRAADGLAEAAAKHPGLFALKVAQLAVAASGLAYWANKSHPEVMDSISAREKEGYWIIPIAGLSINDAQGNPRYLYIRIRKDPLTRAIAAAAETATERLMGKRVDGKRIAMGLKDMAPVDLSMMAVPLSSALSSYAYNKNLWTGEDVWRGQKVSPSMEYDTETPYYLKRATDTAAKLGVEMSPMRLETASQRILPVNGWTGLMGIGIDMTLPNDAKLRRSLAERILSLPMARTLIGMTRNWELTKQDLDTAKRLKVPVKDDNGSPRPTRVIRDDIADAQLPINNDRQVRNVILDGMVVQARNGKITVNDIRKWVRTFDKDEQDRLFSRLELKHTSLGIKKPHNIQIPGGR